MKRKQSKAIVTLNDFSFYVIYQYEAGYGNHTQQQMRKHVRNNITGCKVYNKNRFKQTEWVPLKESEGMASIKYVGELTFSGISQLIYNACLSDVNETMGSLTEYGHFPAVSLSNEYSLDYSVYISDMNDIKKRFGNSDCVRSIYEFQGIQNDELYVSCCFSENRFNEIVEYVLKSYTGNDKDFVINNIKENILNICDQLIQHIRHLTDENYESNLVPGKIKYDSRQLVINFNNESV